MFMPVCQNRCTRCNPARLLQSSWMKRSASGTVTIWRENINVLRFPNLAKCASSPSHCVCQLLWGLISIAVLEGPSAGDDCPLFHTLLVGPASLSYRNRQLALQETLKRWRPWMLLLVRWYSCQPGKCHLVTLQTPFWKTIPWSVFSLSVLLPNGLCKDAKNKGAENSHAYSYRYIKIMS